MSQSMDRAAATVEVRPEVVFLGELLDELTQGRLRIPRFQRPFIWRRDQMTDLLDSIYKQYPIGSLLVWETEIPLATLERLGPFVFPARVTGQPVGFLLDGHQRLSTLAGALVPREEVPNYEDDQDPERWDLVWNLKEERFQHGVVSSDPALLFPMTALLDTRRFFDAVDDLRGYLGSHEDRIAFFLDSVTAVAQAFQYYRVPVIRIRQTGISEAVEIFARLNSKGQAMSADQMVSALMYRQSAQGGAVADFDLASEIDGLSDGLASMDFPDVDRTTILRAILANLGEDIYRTDYTRLSVERRADLLPRMREAVERTSASLDRAVGLLRGLGVRVGRLLPYTMQLVILSAFFDRRPYPTPAQESFLERWFWVSSFTAWFGTANPSRINSLVSEFRRAVAANDEPSSLENFDMAAAAHPHPLAFDMRSARTRCLLMVLLALEPRDHTGTRIESPWREVALKGPSAIGHIVPEPPKTAVGSPANRMYRPPEAPSGSLRSYVMDLYAQGSIDVLESYGIDLESATSLASGDLTRFFSARQGYLIRLERDFQERVGVQVSSREVAMAPIDTG